MTIPTDATHEVFIHDLNVVRVDVRMSALEPGLRTLVEKLSQELHEARAHLYNARQSRDEYLDELEQIRSLLGAGPGVTALEAVKQAQKEIGEARSEANRCFAEHEAMRRARDAAKRDLSAAVDTIGAIGEALGCGLGEAVLDAAARVVRERDEARRECNSDFVSRIAGILGASRNETTLNAAARVVCERDAYLARVKDLESDVCKLAKERDEANMRLAHAKAERDGARREREEAREALAKANASLETERIAGRVATEFWQARITTLEAAIRNLAKVLP